MTNASANHGSDTIATKAADPHASYRLSTKAYPANKVVTATIGADGDVTGPQPPREPALTTGWHHEHLND